MKTKMRIPAQTMVPNVPTNFRVKKAVLDAMAGLDRKHGSLDDWKSTAKRTSHYVLVHEGKEYPAAGLLGPKDIHGYLRHPALQHFRFESKYVSDWSELELTLLFAFLHAHDRAYPHTDSRVQSLCDALNSGAVRQRLHAAGLPTPVARTASVEPRTPFSVAPKLVQLLNLMSGQDVGFLPPEKSPERALWSKLRGNLAPYLGKALEILKPKHAAIFERHCEQPPGDQQRRLRKPADGTLQTEAGKTGVGRFQLLPFQPKSSTTVPRSSTRLGMNCVARRTHEAIVNALARTLLPTRCELRYDPVREDLVAIWPDRVILFEVKTDTRAPSVEQGLGQLMIYGIDVAEAYAGRSFMRVLVVPCRPSGSGGRACRSALVYIMTFRRVADDEFTFTEDPKSGSTIFTHARDRTRRTMRRRGKQ
jgi:hypothetical protein